MSKMSYWKRSDWSDGIQAWKRVWHQISEYMEKVHNSTLDPHSLYAPATFTCWRSSIKYYYEIVTQIFRCLLRSEISVANLPAKFGAIPDWDVHFFRILGQQDTELCQGESIHARRVRTNYMYMYMTCRYVHMTRDDVTPGLPLHTTYMYMYERMGVRQTTFN